MWHPFYSSITYVLVWDKRYVAPTQPTLRPLGLRCARSRYTLRPLWRFKNIRCARQCSSESHSIAPIPCTSGKKRWCLWLDMVILGQTPDCASFTQLKSLDKPLNHGPRFGYVAPANDAFFSCARPKSRDSPLCYWQQTDTPTREGS